MKTIGMTLTALALASCAAVDKPAPQVAKASSGTYFCWRDRLHTQGDELMCNWESDKREACIATHASPMRRANVASGPTEAGRCENGQWLVQITTR